MKIRALCSLFLFSGCFFLSAIAYSQTDSEEPPEEELCTLTVSSVFRLQGDVYYRDLNGEFVVLNIGFRNRGTPVDILKGLDVPLYREVTVPATQTKAETISYDEIMRLEFNADWKSVIVVLLPGKNQPIPYIMEDSLEAHPDNSIRVINLTPLEVAIQVADNLKQIKPGMRNVLPLPMESGKPIPFAIATRIDANQEWIRYLKTSLRMRKNSLRNNFFLVRIRDEKTEEPSMASFSITGLPPKRLE